MYILFKADKIKLSISKYLTTRHDEYGDTFYMEERCFIADYTSPDHCANDGYGCDDDVLNFGSRIRRD